MKHKRSESDSQSVSQSVSDTVSSRRYSNIYVRRGGVGGCGEGE